MTEKQFLLDKDAFEHFVEVGKPIAALQTLLETLLDADKRSEWLDKTIALLFSGYICQFPFAGYPVMRLEMIAIARYLELSDRRIPKAVAAKFYGDLNWWFIQSEGVIKAAVIDHAESDNDFRWALRVILRQLLIYKGNHPGELSQTYLPQNLLTMIDPAFVSDGTSIWDTVERENSRMYVFQRPMRFEHCTQPQ